MTDQSRAAAVAAALRAWLTVEFGGPVNDAEKPRSDTSGRASVVHFVRFTGPRLPVAWTRPLVVRVHRSAGSSSAAREAAIQDWCCDRGYPAPRVRKVFEPGTLLALPAQVVDRAPGASMFDAAKRSPWNVPRLVDDLVLLHHQLHALPTEGWPEGPEPRLAHRRLQKARRLAPDLADPELTSALEQVDTVLPELSAAEGVACHGDFHPLNIVSDGDVHTVVDWTDAALGSREGDVARTAWLLRFGVPRAHLGRVRRSLVTRGSTALAERYLDRCRRIGPLDPLSLRRWSAIQFVDTWATALAALREAPEPPSAEQQLGLDWVRERFTELMA